MIRSNVRCKCCATCFHMNTWTNFNLVVVRAECAFYAEDLCKSSREAVVIKDVFEHVCDEWKDGDEGSVPALLQR